MLESLSKVFNRPELQKLLSMDGFPIRIQVPFQFAVHATIQFTNFK
jgi:hypothetical protein